MDIFDLIKVITNREVNINACTVSDIGCRLINKNSASNAAVGFCEILDNSISNDEFPVAVKMFLSVDKSHDSYLDYKGLLYEVSVYKKINKVLHHTPNLIPFVGYGKCDVNMITEYFKETDVEKFLETQFPNTYTKSHTRKLHILITGRPEKSMSLKNMLNVSSPAKNTVIAKLKLWFQLIYTLKVLSDYNIQHNDLHESNVIVGRYPTHKKILYVINNTEFLIDTLNVVYIFDWDRAYTPSLGDNDLLYQWSHINTINKIQPKFDLFTISCLQTYNYFESKHGFEEDEDPGYEGVYKDLLRHILKGSDISALKSLFTDPKDPDKGFLCRPLVNIKNRAMDYVDILNLPVFKMFVYDKDRDGDYDYKYVMP